MPDAPLTLRAAPGRSPIRLIMVARFEPQKDHATLLQALGRLRNYPWELELIGDGPLRPEMESLATSLAIRERVHFLGQRTDVAQRLADAQLSLLVSNWEGFPLSILEAMRAGLPVVASGVGGVDEAVRNNETGFVVPRGDVELLKDRIERLLASPDLRTRLGRNGRLQYERQFTLDHLVANTLAVYRDALRARRGRVAISRAETEPAPASDGPPSSDRLQVGG
jgi:glycosyltransferase involved in cell wall biosynthesis